MFRKKEYRYSLMAGFVLVVWAILANGGLAWAQNTLVYFTQNGKQLITRSGSTVNFRSGTTFINAATTTNSGTTSQTGAWTASGTAAVTGASLAVTPVITYSKCGKATIALDSTGVYVAVTGVVPTDVVLATVAQDTALTVRAIPKTGYIRLVASGKSTDSTGLAISWAVLRPQ